MSFSKYILSCLVLLLSFQGQAQIAKAKKGTYALTNATIETITNGTITNGTLIITDGKITALGADVKAPTGANVIDCKGMIIYPGMIDGGTRLGLSEVGSVALTQDFNEIGDVIPHMQALTAVNPNSVSIPVTRVSGVTTVIAKPSGGTFPGTAALINLAGYTPKQMYAGFKGVILNFPRSGRRSRWDRRSDEDIKKAQEKAQKKLNETWEDAVLYHKIKTEKGKMDYNPEMNALSGVLSGEVTLMVEANKKSDILAAIKWIQDKKIPKAILTGVAEGWRVADKIVEAKLPVVTGPILTQPSRSSDHYAQAYTNAGLMQKAGVKVAIRTNETENVRNLPFNAGFAATYGMGKEEAMKAITIIPAEIFGVADQLGSLEVGKSATLYVATGDPFEPKTKIKHLFIDGYNISMDSRHTQLYEEFLERTPGLKE